MGPYQPLQGPTATDDVSQVVFGTFFVEEMDSGRIIHTRTTSQASTRYLSQGTPSRKQLGKYDNIIWAVEKTRKIYKKI